MNENKKSDFNYENQEEEKIIIPGYSYSKADKAAIKSFFKTILFGITLSMFVIFLVVRNSTDAEYVFGISSLLLAIAFLISVVKKK